MGTGGDWRASSVWPLALGAQKWYSYMGQFAYNGWGYRLWPASIMQGFVDASGLGWYLSCYIRSRAGIRRARQLLIAVQAPHGLHGWLEQESCCDLSVGVTVLLRDAAERGPDVQSEEITL